MNRLAAALLLLVAAAAHLQPAPVERCSVYYCMADSWGDGE